MALQLWRSAGAVHIVSNSFLPVVVFIATGMAAFAADQDAKLPTQASVGVAFDARAGTAKAGMLCLPSGGFRVADFVASDVEFANQAREAFLSNGARATTAAQPEADGLRIRLDRIEASLCARKYGAFGLGDKRSLSGQVEFEFSWTVTGDLIARHEIVRLAVPKTKGKPAEAFLQDALAVFAERVAGLKPDKHVR